jgi:hypothetical protein
MGFKMKQIAGNRQWGTADDFEAMFRLLLKAIEAAHVHSTFGSKLDKA